MASFSRIPFDFEVYTVKEALSDSGELVGERVVKRFIKQMHHPNEHCLYTDNFFSSENLLSLTKEKSIRHTGTGRQNRIKKCLVTCSKEFKTEEREKCKGFRAGDVVLVNWNDSKQVFVMSNFESICPLRSVKRWSKNHE